MFIEKNTNQDKVAILAAAVRDLKIAEGYASGYSLDFDDSYVYFEAYKSGTGYKTYKAKYTYNGTSATIDEGVTEVVRTSNYKEVKKSGEIEELVKSFLEKHFGATKKEIPVIKAFDEEKMEAVMPLYILPGDVDLHGDTITKEENRKMVNGVIKAVESGELTTSWFHRVDAGDDFKIAKAWVNECDCYLGDNLVKEEQPLALVKFLNKEAWQALKDGELGGLSIEANAEWEIVQ